MRYNLCSSFPLADMIKFHKHKEKEMLDHQEHLNRGLPSEL